MACKAQESYHGCSLRELLRKYVDLLTTVLRIKAMTGVSYESHSRLMRLRNTIGKGDAHARDSWPLEPLRAGAPKAILPQRLFSFFLQHLRQGSLREEPQATTTTRLPPHHLPFNTLREPKAARGVLAHGQEEKKEFIEEERAQTTTL